MVAIDVNSGRATREASIEETALKTNTEAAEEAARQMRLRDLAGLIVIDFIDMEDRRNNAAVEKKLKDKLKTDRARIQVGRISAFGLLEMSRQRLRPGMIEATTKGCPHCHGTGRVRSDDSMALALLREIEEEGVKQRSKEVLIVAPVEISNYLLNQKREHIAMIESRFGLSVRVEGDASLISPDYRVERFKTASRVIPMLESTLASVPYPDDDIVEEEDVVDDEEEATVEPAAASSGEGNGNGDRQSSNGKRKRRRRRRGGKSSQDGAASGDFDAADGDADTGSAAVAESADAAPAETAEPAFSEPAAAEPEERPKSRRRSRGGRSAPEPATVSEAAPEAPAEPQPAMAAAAPPSPFGEVIDPDEEAHSQIVEVPETGAPPRRTRERVRKPVTTVVAEAITSTVESVTGSHDPKPDAPEPAPEPEPEPEIKTELETKPEPDPEPTAAAEPEPEPEPEHEPAEEGPKRRGWWSRALS